MFKKIAISVFIVLVVAAVILLMAKNSSNGKDNGIKMIKVQKGDIVEKALAIGRIEPKNEIAVKSKISGIVNTVFVEVGDVVKKGQPLLEIKPDPTPLEFAETKKNVEIAKVYLEKAENEYDRMKKLLKDNLVSEQDYDAAENEYKQLQLRLNLAQERLALIEDGRTKIADRQVDTVIKSPVKGTVLERRVNEGDPVVPLTSYQAGTELLMLADMESLIFKGTVDEIDVGKLEVGMTAELKIGAIPDEKIFGELTKISPKAKQQENATLFDVEIEITQRGEKIIRAGYSTNADLVINKAENALFIPERLVEFNQDRTYVEVKDVKGEIIKREVKIGLSDGINVEIQDGLEEGEEVVEKPPKEIK
ncbi:MAG: efflux RND transporter periplasmic adaptor subunit [Candidatus Aminicenantes bacterium]|nr:efflux RND transporter periplasmic adaptor subunit [Candidatus Aminicenantes bacterium]